MFLISLPAPQYPRTQWFIQTIQIHIVFPLLCVLSLRKSLSSVACIQTVWQTLSCAVRYVDINTGRVLEMNLWAEIQISMQWNIILKSSILHVLRIYAKFSYESACVVAHNYVHRSQISAAGPYDCLGARIDRSERNASQDCSAHHLSCIIPKLSSLTAEDWAAH